MTRWALVLGAVALSFGLSVSAQAQKAKDNLRVALAEPISTLVLIEDPRPEPELFGTAVFDTLFCYDGNKGKFYPLLAKSWSWTDDRTLEIKLRDDVHFHDGSKMTADDVVYTLKYEADPASKLRFITADLDWLDHVEKVDDYTVRLVAKRPTPIAEILLANNSAILPAKLHGSYKIKTDFGRQNPIGTGPYKVVSLDPSAGVKLTRVANYPQGNECKPAGKIGNVQGIPITDQQTRIAQLTTGGVDLIRGKGKDEADLLAEVPGIEVTPSEGLQYWYLGMDSVNRSGNAALSDQRVRRAISQAINREEVARNVVPGGKEVVTTDALCRPVERACDFSTKPPPYDVAAAKKLLAEAGYPDGFDLEITAPTGADNLAEAIGGELRKVGIRAVVDKVTIGGYRQKQAAGKIQALAWLWGQPDVYSTAEYFFNMGPRDYWHDATLNKLREEGLATTDLAKRKAIYRQLFDRVNAMNYILPISTNPDIFIHTADLYVKPGSLTRTGADLDEMHWK